MPLGTEVDHSPGDIVLDGDPASPCQIKGAQQPPPFFWPMRCDPLAGWITMPLGTEVDLGPGHIVLHGDPDPQKKGHSSPPPNFWPMSVVAKWLDGSICHLVQS